ncbi:hypothetical protein EYC80_001042 [Monilinia laxa]|uniref:Uncharacterized protein n=1 Tax=Monilinia laxa TaxID=61186 RepID=A0A5N6K841_MONLA|nr:hypothetical protein EYC80_001042 [Monilinia laxa]
MKPRTWVRMEMSGLFDLQVHGVVNMFGMNRVVNASLKNKKNESGIDRTDVKKKMGKRTGDSGVRMSMR